MRPIYQTRTLSVRADADGIALDQAMAAAGDMVLTGAAFVTAGVAQLGAQRQVLFTPGAGDDLTGVNFTIYGTGDGGIPQSEVVAGANGVTWVSALSYSTVTRIAVSAAFGAGETVSVGTNGVGAGPPIPVDQYLPSFNIMLAVILRSGAANYTVQYTFDNVFDAYNNQERETMFMNGAAAGDPSKIVWWPHADITAQAVSAKGSLVNPVKAVRLVTNSGTGELEFQVIQAGDA